VNYQMEADINEEKNNKHVSDSIRGKISDIPDDRLVTSSRIWKEVADVMSKDVVTISPDATMISASRLMSDKGISCVIVTDNASVVGILTETDILNRFASGEKNPHKVKVGEIMSFPVQTDLNRALTSCSMWKNVIDVMSSDVAGIDRKTTVAEALKVMTSRSISCIIILQGDEPIGVFTKKDLLKNVVAPRKNPNCMHLKEVMSSPVISIPPDYSIFSASSLMEKMNIRRLIVTKDKELCGIITQTDIFMAVKRKLQEEEEKNLRLLEDSESSIYTLDLNGKITYVNPAFTKLLEVYDPAQLINQTFLPERFWLNPDDKIQFLNELKKHDVKNRELTLKTFGGKRVYVNLFCSFTKNMHGEINGSQGILSNITERKRMYEILDRKQKNLEAIFDASPVGMLLVGEDMIVKRVNDKIRKMVGREYLEIINRLFGCALGCVNSSYSKEGCGHSPSCRSCLLRKAIENVFNSSGSAHHVEGQFKFKVDNEEIRPWLCVSVEIVVITGQRHAVVVLSDITDRKQIEDKMKVLNEELKTTVEKLTVSNLELQDFAKVIAHDLKVPVQAVTSLADWISADYADKLDERGKEAIALLVNKANRIDKMMNAILKYSGVGRDQEEEEEEVNLNDLVTEVYQDLCPPENITITIEKDLPCMMCRRARTSQVFQNLLSNTIKYIDKSEGQIKVGCIEDDSCWKFYVADNGPGIEAKYFEKIFEVFQTLHPRNDIETTGIGLALVKKIVKMHGGEIWVESELGKGSTFFFTIPKRHSTVSSQSEMVCGSC